MITRTVLAIDALGEVDPNGSDVMMVKAERAAIDVQAARKYRRLNLSTSQLPDWAAPDGVRERGLLVRKALCAHPGLVTIFDHLALTPAGQMQPLFLKLSAGDAEQIPWETLCDGQGEFLALDKRWPIGRVTDPLNGRSRPPAVLCLPVRLLALISAYGVESQKNEWKALAGAVQEARNAGLDVKVRVLVADAATQKEVQKSIAAGMTDLEFAGIDSTAARVVQDIVGWQPNVLHFFCHGHAGSLPADQSLELATVQDMLKPGQGSVRIRTRQLSDMLEALTNPWLVTLNCCSSAAASAELLSLASQVVGAGFPAAVAMIEPVDASDAYEFTRAFYRALFADLKTAHAELKALAGGAAVARVPFEFARAMHEARTAICDLHGGDAPNQRQWVLPALYVRGVEPLEFQPPPPMSEGAAVDYKQRARVVAAWLQQVRETLDEAGRREVMEQSLATVPHAFWPDVNGNLGGTAVDP